MGRHTPIGLDRRTRSSMPAPLEDARQEWFGESKDVQVTL